MKPAIKNKSLIGLSLAGLLGSILIAFGVVVLNPGRQPWQAFISGLLLSALCIIGIWAAWKWSRGPRWLLICIVLAFALRILFGFSMTALLPQWGYPEPAPQQGYLYLDAFNRDQDAWQLARSGQSLATAYGEEFSTDQYGGLLSLSAVIYRVLSPDAHRPSLILILAAVFPALGIAFLWKALADRWNTNLAGISSWIAAFYPESIVLGGSQMREPFLIGLSAVAAWGVVEWKHSHRNSLIAIFLSLLGMAFFSWLAAAAVSMVIFIWFWLDIIHPHLKKNLQPITWILLALIVLGGILFSLSWLTDSARWDLYLMESSSGRIQFELDTIGRQWRIPFIVAYGLFQPVLPAALAYPGIVLMRLIAFFRAIGWYAISPVLIFSLLAIIQEKDQRNRKILLWFWIAFLIWMLISSIRAGGDQWDNVRYRAIFTIFMSIVAGWGWLHAKEKYGAWLKRFYLVEGVFIIVFLQWYLSRYYRLFGRFPFWTMTLVILGLSIAILAGGLLSDRIKSKKKSKVG
jgi:hypothetical protein